MDGGRKVGRKARREGRSKSRHGGRVGANLRGREGGREEGKDGGRRECITRRALQMEELSKEKEASVAHIEEIQRETAQLEERRGEIESEMAEHLPVQKGMLALYVNVTNVRFDYDAANVKGIVFPAEGEDDVTPR